MSTAEAVTTQVRKQLMLTRVARYTPWILSGAAIVFALLWVLVLAQPCGDTGCTGTQTNFGSAVHDPQDFLATLLDGLTSAGVYFVVASGFTLIFGLMRPSLIAAVCIGILGLGMQQVFLRWNQGQELRQALITIAISIILADQMVAHFGAFAEDIAWPGVLDRRLDLKVAGVHYTLTRLFILAVAVGIGLALWLWLKKTRTGMVIRAGVDDRQMVSALGVNIQLTFAIAFFVGSALAGFGGALGGSFASLGPGVDGNWLLYSLVVVIIGGMGSLGGAAVGALLLGLVSNFSSAYLPGNYTFYSIIFTFVLLAIVLAFRPLGLFGRPA